MDTLDQILDNLWTSDYVQKNPNKAYKTQYNTEYMTIAQYMNGGTRPNPTNYSKMGKVLVGLEDQRRANVPPVPPVGEIPIYVADFETGDFSQIISQQESSAGRITLVPGLTWGDRWSCKTLIGPSDKGVAGSGNSYRTEVWACVIAQKFGWLSLQGRETWITWDALYGAGFEFPDDPNSWLLFTQFWTPGLEFGSPCFAVNVAMSEMYVTQRGGTELNSNTRLKNLGAVPLDQRVSWKIHRIWSTGSGATTNVWRNGVKVIDADHLPNLAVGYEGSVEFKFGTYRSGIDPPLRDSYALHDNIKFWTSDPDGGSHG